MASLTLDFGHFADDDAHDSYCKCRICKNKPSYDGCIQIEDNDDLNDISLKKPLRQSLKRVHDLFNDQIQK